MIQSFTLSRLILVAAVAFLVLTASPRAHSQVSNWCLQQESDWSRSLKRQWAVEITNPGIARSMRIELELSLVDLERSYSGREIEGPSPPQVCAPFFHEIIAVARFGEALVADG